jgi:hypothetical protein
MVGLMYMRLTIEKDWKESRNPIAYARLEDPTSWYGCLQRWTAMASILGPKIHSPMKGIFVGKQETL